MNFITAFWEDLKPVLRAAWPEVAPQCLFLDNVVERIDWTQRMNDAELSAPWVVVSLSASPSSEWGTAPIYIVTSTIHYITSLDIAKKSSTTVTALIISKLTNLQNLLYTNQTLGTVLEVDFDISAENAVNVSMLNAKLPFQAGMLSTQIVTVAQ